MTGTTRGGAGCDGWRYVTQDECRAYCAANAVANGCDYGSDGCTHISHSTASSSVPYAHRLKCHLFSSCQYGQYGSFTRPPSVVATTDPGHYSSFLALQRPFPPILGKCGDSEVRDGDMSCSRWDGVTLDKCMAICAGNTVAGNCADTSSNCTHIGFWPITGQCQLYRSCEDTVRAHPTSNLTPHRRSQSLTPQMRLLMRPRTRASHSDVLHRY